MFKTKGDNKTYQGNLSDPIYSLNPSKLGQGPDQGAVGRGAARNACYMEWRAFELWTSAECVGDPWVVGREDSGNN